MILLENWTQWKDNYVSQNKPQQLLESIQIVLAGHKDTEDVSPDLSVHPLLPCQLQHFLAELKEMENSKRKKK